DSDDPRTDNSALVLTAGPLAIGCIFDATAAGLATTSHPFAAADDFDLVARRLFGRSIGLLLHASTHRPEISFANEWDACNPGSAVLPAEGAPPSFLSLTDIGSGGLVCTIVYLG